MHKFDLTSFAKTHNIHTQDHCVISHKKVKVFSDISKFVANSELTYILLFLPSLCIKQASRMLQSKLCGLLPSAGDNYQTLCSDFRKLGEHLTTHPAVLKSISVGSKSQK